MKYTVCIVCMLLSKLVFAQPKVITISKTSIPKSISYKGNIVKAVEWKETSVKHIVLLTEKHESKTDTDERSAALYVYHYTVTNDSAVQTWKVYDHVDDCPLDIILSFIDDAFAVTDLDNNGKPEVWIMYKISCQGDVSPIPMKIIMYEDNKKFAVRGTAQVNFSEKEFEGGEFTFDDAFKNGNIVFRTYATKLWEKHKIHSWK